MNDQATTATSVAELTLRAVVVGLILSVVMGAANVYLGLKAGMTVSASIPAAVIGMLILRAMFKGGTILEANQIQTAASAGESLAAGIIFTMPALILIGVWQQFDMVLTAVIAFTGGLLGILFMIPMRRVFVVNPTSELRFPEGVACASVLKVADKADGDPSDAMAVVKGAAIGAVFKISVSLLGVIHGVLETAFSLGNRIFYFGGDVSPALLGVGVIVRLNVALLIFIGGGIGWLIGIPLLGGAEAFDGALDGAWTLWSTQVRYVGVGAMVIGGIASIVKVRHGLVQAVNELRNRKSAANSADPRQRDIPSKAISGLAALAILLVAGVYYHLTGSAAITLATTVIMVVMAFFFTAVASYIVGLVGNSNSPVSGMTITAVLFTGALLLVFGFAGTEGMVATLGVAAIVCCAACTSGDVCNDLKTGQLVGASPRRQQIMQVLGVGVASLVMAPVLQLLHDNTPGGIGGRELSAPQAGLFASLAQGFFGNGQLPWNMVIIGAFIGVGILIIDRILENKQSDFRAHLMPIAVGLYLPFGLAVPIFAGGLLEWRTRRAGGDGATSDAARGVLFSSGVVAGEALVGVGVALLIGLGVTVPDLGFGGTGALSLAAALVVLWLFQRGTRSSVLR